MSPASVLVEQKPEKRRSEKENQVLVLRLLRRSPPKPPEGKFPGQPGSRWYGEDSKGNIYYVSDQDQVKVEADPQNPRQSMKFWDCQVGEDVSPTARSSGRIFEVRLLNPTKAKKKAGTPLYKPGKSPPIKAKRRARPQTSRQLVRN